MTIQEMHEMIVMIKNQGQNGYHDPDKIDRALNSASFDKFNEEKRMFESNGYISDNLSLFKKFGSISLTSGFGNLPSDYDYRTNASLADDTEVDIVDEAEWVNRLKDPIDPPTAARPVCAIRNQVEVRPTSISSIRLYYLRKPATMKFGYNVSGSDYVYDSGTSTNCDWPESCHVDIVLRSLVYLGVPLSDESLVRLKAYKKQTESV